MKRRINTYQKGFTLLEILLVIGIMGVIAVFTIAISHSIRNMTKLNDTRSRMEQIAAKAKEFYRSHETLPLPGTTPANSVPVGASDLNMEQKFRLDGWGQYLKYLPGGGGGSGTVINDMDVDGMVCAGVVISYGPNQTNNYVDTAGAPTGHPIPPATQYFGTSGDDIIIAINVSQEAGEIALEELKELQSKVKAFDAVYEGVSNDIDSIPDNDTDSLPGNDGCFRADPSTYSQCPPVSGILNNDPNCGTATLDEIDSTSGSSYNCSTTPGYTSALDLILGHYSLADPGYRTDPWGNSYVWGRNGLSLAGGGTISQSDSRYHKFFSLGPNNTDNADDIIP